MKLFVFLILTLGLAALFYALGGAKYLEISELGLLLQNWRATIATNTWFFVPLTTLIYVVLMSTPLPITALSILSAGYLFGFWVGVPVILIASLAASIATFLLCRHVFAELVEARINNKLESVRREIEKAGFFYSLSLRLSAVVPFFLLNCVQAVTNIKLSHFALATLLGMIPVSMVLVNAGTRLAEIDRIEDVFDAKIAVSLLLVATLPLLIRIILPKFTKATD